VIEYDTKGIYRNFCQSLNFTKNFKQLFFELLLLNINKKAQTKSSIFCFIFFFYQTHFILDVIRHFYRILRLESRCMHQNRLKKVIYNHPERAGSEF